MCFLIGAGQRQEVDWHWGEGWGVFQGEGPDNVKLTVQRSDKFLWHRENVSMVAAWSEWGCVHWPDLQGPGSHKDRECVARPRQNQVPDCESSLFFPTPLWSPGPTVYALTTFYIILPLLFPYFHSNHTVISGVKEPPAERNIWLRFSRYCFYLDLSQCQKGRALNPACNISEGVQVCVVMKVTMLRDGWFSFSSPRLGSLPGQPTVLLKSLFCFPTVSTASSCSYEVPAERYVSGVLDFVAPSAINTLGCDDISHQT